MRCTGGSILCLIIVAGILLPATGAATCGWSVIDHRVQQDESGLWNPDIYRAVFQVLTAAQVGGAVWEGAETRIGKTMWQGIDSQLVTLATTEVMRRSLGRVRPAHTSDPCEWFQHGNYSFPSGEASSAAALVAPYVLEYGHEYPLTYGLLILPLYIGVGRVKAQAHWQSDVIAGWTVGGLAGWYANSRETPLLVEILPHGAVVGLKTRF